MENREDFIMIEMKTETGEVFQVPILRSADEIKIGFHPQRDVFCLLTKHLMRVGFCLLPASVHDARRAERLTSGLIRPALAMSVQSGNQTNMMERGENSDFHQAFRVKPNPSRSRFVAR